MKTSTSTVLTGPYTPSSWIERACALIRLGYPDLAALDAFKAIVLFSRPEFAVYEQIEAPKGRNARGGRNRQVCTGTTKTLEEQSRDANLVLAIALFFANSFHECLETLEFCNGEKAERLSRFARQGLDQERQFHLRKGLSPEQAEEELRAGTIRWTVYPWTRKDFVHRTEETMAPLKDGVQRDSESSCAIKRSMTIRTPGTHKGRAVGPNEVWGMFSRKDIAAGEPLFKNSTAFVSCSQEFRCSTCGDNSATDAFQLSCCSLIFCTKKCMETSLGLSHNSRDCIGPPTLAKIHNPSVRKVSKINRKDLDHLSSPSSETTEKEKVQADLLQKIISSAYKHSATKDQHPLTYPLVRNLTIARGADEAVEFSLKKDIIFPISILEKLGIDIFTNPHFDAWVLQTIQARLRANTWERNVNGVEFLGLSPLFSLFNHCCWPNVKWSFGKDGTTIELKTLRPIGAGEELYISYLQPEDLALRRVGRKKKLVHWFPGCQCPKCKEEEEEEETERAKRGGIRRPQKKRLRVATDAKKEPTKARREPMNARREPVQLLSPEPESDNEEDLRALLATVKVDDDNDLDFSDIGLSDVESGYESSTPASGKRRRKR